MLALSKDGLINSSIIYAETDKTFNEIRSFALQENRMIHHFELFEILGNPLRVQYWEAEMYRQPYIKDFGGNLLLYFFRRMKKFKGTSWEKFILHLKETEWRFNQIINNKKIKSASTDNEKLYLISKNLYEDMLKILRNNPL